MSETKEELIKRLKAEGFSDEQIEKILAALEGRIATRQVITRISPTGRGALFRLKRAFYAIINAEKADREKSTEFWREFASKIVEAGSKYEIQDKPCRIRLEYAVKETPEGLKVVRPISATIEVYDKVSEIKIA
ncbi:MAG: hypothetical protein NDF55_01205 [archaeon GB-1867-005]|nr:hypothetical protein [Candidatus Culexmicrobium cathedralense]